jgi:transposase
MLAAEGRHTLEELAQITGRARATIQNWLGKFARHRIAGLLKRHTPPGTISPLADQLVQSQLRAGLKAGRWTSAAAVARWLDEAHGIHRSRKSIYYWLRKNGWASPGNNRQS